MISHKRIYNYLFKELNSIVFLFGFLFVAMHSQAQVKLKEHKKVVELSKKTNSALCSRDTLYCSGIALAYVKNSNHTEVLGKQIVYNKDTSQILIQIELKCLQDAKGINTFYNQFTFPVLNKSCDVKTTDLTNGAYSVLCENGLINAFGLDTLKAEVFVTLKGSIIGNSTLKSDPIVSAKSLIIARDKKAKIEYNNEEIRQGEVLIGHYEIQTLEGPVDSSRQYKVFNILGALICTAVLKVEKDKSQTTRNWSLLTHKDNRFRSALIKGDNELDSLILYLIEENLL